ncbi:MAG: glycosyltransferase family 4 protein [Roseibium sp.]
MEENGETGAAQTADPLVLHLSADYPDPHRGHRKTTAIERLVRGAGYGRHIVVSLNRTSLPWKTHFIDCGDVGGVRLYAYRYFALPGGLGLARSMRIVAERVRKMMEDHQPPALVHAHKFSFEGIAGLWLAEHYGPDTRFFVSVRGEAERKVLLFKPFYRGLMRRIAKRADRIYHISAWFLETYHRHIPEQPDKECLLPNIVDNTTREVPRTAPEDRFVSVFDLNMRKRKGMSDLLHGFKLFHEAHPDTGLDLIGPGSEESVAAARSKIGELGLEANVRLLGPMKSDDLFAALPRYLGMALVSYNETFGMVYPESLFAGVPIIYGKDTGIDGYLDDMRVGIGVRPGDVAGIASAFATLKQDNSAFRDAIADGVKRLHERFDPDSILAGYRADMRRFLQSTDERNLKP